MMQDPVQHCRCQCGIAGECLILLAERKIRRQERRTFFIPFGYNLEE